MRHLKRSESMSQEIKHFGIVGGGAAGMAIAINARYEGYSVMVFEKRPDIGGAYCHTPLIHNLPGFPSGISGYNLSSGSREQLLRLGGMYISNCEIIKICREMDHFVLWDQNGKTYKVYKVIITIGTTYKKLDIENSRDFEGKGIYYEPDDSLLDKLAQSENPICIYGAGNSAGQAALFYDSLGIQVYLIYRDENLYKSMSKYLITRINASDIKQFNKNQIVSLEGDKHLEAISLDNGEKIRTEYLFVMIGGIPPTIPKVDCGEILLSKRGYIQINPPSWATNVPGIWAAGDITSVGAGRLILAQAQGVSAFIEARST